MIKHHNGVDFHMTFDSVCVSIIDDSPQVHIKLKEKRNKN